jgi:hypothetical protein
VLGAFDHASRDTGFRPSFENVPSFEKSTALPRFCLKTPVKLRVHGECNSRPGTVILQRLYEREE